MLLYIIRHGDPIYDPDSLTELGHKQAEALVPRLAPLGFDKIFVSPMIRAQQTAEPTCKALGMIPEVRDFLSEEALYKQMSFVQKSGRRRWCFHQQVTNYKTAKTYRMTKNWYSLPAFEGHGESIKAGFDRICRSSDEFLSELGYVNEGDHYRIENPPYERVGVFCHQGVGLTWMSHMLNIPPHILWSSFDITHTGITVLNFENYENKITMPICLCMSDTSHLFSAGIPLKYQGQLPY